MIEHGTILVLACFVDLQLKGSQTQPADSRSGFWQIEHSDSHGLIAEVFGTLESLGGPGLDASLTLTPLYPHNRLLSFAMKRAGGMRI